MPRNGTKNLIPTNKRSIEEVKKNASKGGKKSGEVRRARKTLKEELLLLLANGDTQNKVSLALIERALEGDVKAFEVIRDTVGEKPVDKVVVAEVDQTIIDEVEAMMSNDED